MIARLACAAAAALLAGCAPALLHEDHPLAGRVWDARAERFLEPAEAWARAAAARQVLLGETHDNPAHQRLHRRALEALAASGTPRLVALEQFDLEHQAALQAARAAGADAEALADAGRFDREGWGWPHYRPLVAFALARGWPIAAANLSRTALRAASTDPAHLATLPAAGPELIAALERDMVDGHCGHRPETRVLAAMVNGQRLRDAAMAAALEAAPGPAVLVAGNGHVRRDRGVPLYLARPAEALVIGQLEVQPGITDPRAYLRDRFSSAASYDLIFFSARAEREDPCRRFRARAHATHDPRAPARQEGLAAALAGAAALDLQGHRGARGLAPENTLPAFATALSLGVHTLELDVGVTRDGVVVVHHDRQLNPATTRGPEGAWLAARGPLVGALTYAELARYDVGRLDPASPYAKSFPQQQPVDGTRIPRLADVFALAVRSGNQAVRFNIETKLSPLAAADTLAPEPFARALLAVIDAAGMGARTTVQSFDWRTLQVVQRLAPEIPTVYLSARQAWLDNIGSATADSPWVAGFTLRAHGSVPRMVRAAGGAGWSPWHGDLDAAALAEARALGLRVVAWTANTPAEIERLLELGVDGIISDRPDLVREAMAARGMPLPAATPVTP